MNTNFERQGFVITFNDHYDDYKTFMVESKNPLYKTILSAFESLKGKEKVVVTVKAKVLDVEFQSFLEFSKLNVDLLTEVINPYFESIEDYETCGEVMETVNKLIR